MNARVKYPVNKQPEFVNELRERVSDYFKTNRISKYGNASLVFKTIFMLNLYMMPYILMLSGLVTSFTGIFISWLIMGIGMAGVGMGVMHDANHKSYSSNPKINKWMGKTLYLLGGFPVNWQYQHNVMHHGFTNIDGQDEDIDPGSVLRLSPHKPRLKVHRFQHIYAWFLYGLMTLSWVTTKDFEQLNRYRRERVNLPGKQSYPRLFMYLILAKIFYYSVFIVIPLLFLPVSWYWVILMFLSMHFLSGLILTTVFQTAHVVSSSHYPVPDSSGSMENNWAVHQLLTTSDFAPKSKIFSWFIGGLNYQIEHHLFPNISHVHYPRIARLVREIAQKYNLPYHYYSGFVPAVIEHGKMLKKLGSNF